MSNGIASVSSELLSPDEASERLESTIRDFFARKLRDPDSGKLLTRVLLRSPPGLGKTQTAFEKKITYQVEQGVLGDLTFEHILKHKRGDIGPTGVDVTVIFTRRHDLAREAKEIIESQGENHGLPITVPILRGRTHEGEIGNAPCKRWKEVDDLQKKGFHVFSNLCRCESKNGVSVCPYYGDCEYIESYRVAYDAPVVLMVHAHLGLDWQSQKEVFADFDETNDDDPGAKKQFKPAYATSVICDEDPTQSLIFRQTFSRSKIESISQGDLGSRLSAGLRAPEGLLSYLRAYGVRANRVRDIAEYVYWEEARGQQVVMPGNTDDAIQKSIPSLKKRIALRPILERLADELECGREGVSYTLVPKGDDQVIAQGRRKYPFTEASLLILDGTANPDILEQFFPHLVMAPEIRVRRNTYVVQVQDLTFYKGSLIEKRANANQRLPKNRLKQVASFIEFVAESGATLVVTNKPVRCALTGENESDSLPVSAPFRGADIAHFGNIRGVNDFENHRNVIILGREQIPVDFAERVARAIWYDTSDPIELVPEDADDMRNYPKMLRPYRLKSGELSAKTVQVSIHPDHRVQAVLEQLREWESLQAIDRLRLIHNDEKKYVWILCSIPLDLPVDSLVTWDSLRGAAFKLWAVLKKCDTNGRNAVSLAAKELSGNFPDLWETTEKASKWLDKKPLDPCIGIIRDWGFLAEYRPQSQRSWSRAIVRHGTTDHRAAIASALSLPTGSVVMRLVEQPH